METLGAYKDRLSVGNKLLRGAWLISSAVFFRPFAGPIFRYWRSLVLRLWGAKVGKRCAIAAGAKIWAPWNLELGDYCTGRFFRPWMFRFGVQTAHPATFFRRSCFDRWGFYSLDYGMFGDFELLCRFIWKNRAKMRYLPLCTTVMRHGGASTGGFDKTLEINRTDLRALKANGCRSLLPILYLRYPFKIWGYVFKKGNS